MGQVDKIPKEELARLLKMENIYIKDRIKCRRPSYDIKVSDSSQNSGEEIVAKIQEVYEIVDTKNYYIIMDGFGDSLREVHEETGYKFSFKTTAQIGI